MSQLLVFGQTFDTAELRLRVIAFLLMITSLVCLIRIERAPPQPTNVRVAIVAHEDFREELTQRTRRSHATFTRYLPKHLAAIPACGFNLRLTHTAKCCTGWIDNDFGFGPGG